MLKTECLENLDLGSVRIFIGGSDVSAGTTEIGRCIVPHPHIRQVVVPVTGARLILGSDGVWDPLTTSRVFSMCRKLPVEAAAQRICSAAFRAQVLTPPPRHLPPLMCNLQSIPVVHPAEVLVCALIGRIALCWGMVKREHLRSSQEGASEQRNISPFVLSWLQASDMKDDVSVVVADILPASGSAQDWPAVRASLCKGPGSWLPACMAQPAVKDAGSRTCADLKVVADVDAWAEYAARCEAAARKALTRDDSAMQDLHRQASVKQAGSPRPEPAATTAILQR